MVLELVDKDIWVVDGPEVPFLGLMVGTRMTIVRVGDELWIHSPVSISDEVAGELESLGNIRYVVAPNKYHHVFLSEWRDRYPEAELYASPGLKVKRQDIAFDSELRATDAYPWSDAIAHTIFGPSRLFDEVVFFHRSSGTLILTDLIINAKTDSYNPFQKLFSAFDGLSYPNGSTPRLYRWSIKSKKAAKEVYQTMIDWAPSKVIISHGEWFRKDGLTELKKRFSWVA
jgi:hypothetical protein